RFNILSNAVLPNSPAAADSASVRFITPGTGVKTNTLTVAGMGTFHTDTTFGADGTVTFTPAPGFSGTVTPVQYTFKDNYGKQATNGTINVTVKPAISNNVISPAGTVNMYNGTLPTGGSGTFTYQWQYSTTDSLSGYTNGGGVSTNQNYTAPAVSDTTWYRRVVTSDGCSVYSNAIGVGPSGVPLPLDLLYFTAMVQGSSVLLSWETGKANKAGAFIVQRSASALDWAPIGTVVAHTEGTYRYTDDQAAAGENFYRLALKSEGDDVVYSPVRRIQMKGASTVQFYPNPTSGMVYIRTEAADAISRLEITAIDGRVLYTNLPLAQALSVDMSSYTSGLYFLHLVRQDGTKTILKLQKL
ncbi:MAG: T9SS type A sorting domain-containing protein, partial [Chitinophagaceae bacterium]|nr:T9SS type A sorting domain-containing protein [Chitinophagaceae bacterium]